MNVLIASILLIVLVILSNIISHYLVSIPTALIEIAVGLIIALVFNIHIDLEADWFMLLFVAPLLFNDGKQFPRNELWELRAPIFANAIWLVFLTTVLGGFFVDALIPQISLPLAMALIAVLSPTDPVAVHGIAEQVKLPKRILSLISGESLINDASGLIAFKYALAAFMTGYFSLTQAAGNFLYMTVVGGLIGFAMISFIHFLRMFLVQQGIQDVVLHTAIQIITPFVIFIVADELAHASGVIAVVTAGVLSINQTPIFRSQHSEVRLVTNKMWDILVYLLNGVVFVILGVELPTAMSETLADKSINNGTLIFYILSIWLMLLVVRVVWSYMYLWINYFKNKNDRKAKPSFNTALLTGLTGVRGAVTMATIMSMPMFMTESGQFFEERSLLIFLACGVVLTSLIVATITLPILTKQRKRLMLVGDDAAANAELHRSPVSETSDATITEIEARQLMVKHAIHTLKIESADSDEQLILTDLIHEFETRLRHLYREGNDDETNRLYSSLEKKVQEVAIRGEKNGVKMLVDSGEVSELAAKNYLKLIDSKEVSMTGGFSNTIKRAVANIRKQINRFFWRYNVSKQDEHTLLRDTAIIKLETQSTKGAIQALKKLKKEITTEEEGIHLYKHIVNQKLHEYLYKLQRIKHFSDKSKNDYQKILQEYYMKALDSERETIQELYQNGQISMVMANQLRQSLNYYESSLLQSEY